jgi:hypothetical protein
MTLVGEYSIQSQAFNTSYLRMDGSGVNEFMPNGGGIVNCKYYLGTGMSEWERFNMYKNWDGSCSFKSRTFNTYLRMDGTGVKETLGEGGGIVNCQYNCGTYEKFILEKQSDNTWHIKSQHFGTYLRMDGTGVTKDGGDGIVNCQYDAGIWEKFYLNLYAQP